MSLEGFQSECKFYDSVNFPHGFARSGDFTKGESDLLMQCGYVIRQITEQGVAPGNDAQQQLLAVVNGERPANTAVEKVWMKYLRVVDKRRSHKVCTLTGGSRGNDYSSEDSSDQIAV